MFFWYRWKKQHPFAPAWEAIEELKLPIKVTQVKDRLNKAALHGRQPARKPLMTAVHRLNRLRWARQWKGYDF